MIESKTREELIKIAKDLKEGKIFCDGHIPEGDERMITSIFMILALADTTELMASQPGMIYEYLSEAGPRAVNGYPIFMSMNVLNREDTAEVYGIYNKLIEAEEELMKTLS